MRNLKRILSLAMASIMLVGMMVVGASAVDFPDSDKIEHTNAVNTMVALGIIKGKDDGNFDPEGIVTRAEMAKMICVAMNGGKDPNLSGGGSYPDTKGHWAAGYIDFCTNLGIVSGDNTGKFNPNNTVTGVEAAKMILIAIGYNAKTEGYVNDPNWDINIGVDANAKNLYEDVVVNPSEGLTRDDAAQMIFNGVQATLVDYKIVGIVDGNGMSQAYDKGGTILSTKFKTADPAPEGVMTSFTYNSTKAKWTYYVSGQPSFTTAEDFTSLMGRKVRVIAQTTGDKVVYGMFPVESEVVAEGYTSDLGAIKNNEVKFDGTTYKLNTTINKYNFASGTAADLTTLGYVQLVDNDADGKVDTFVLTPFTVAKVTYVGKDSVTLNGGLGNMKFEDINVYDGIAKDDVVVFYDENYTADYTDTVVKAETQSGTVTGTKNVDGKANYLIDGTWYTKDAAADSFNVNDDVEFVAFGSTIYSANVTEGTVGTGSLGMVYAMGDKTTTGADAGTKLEAKIILADGTKKTVIINKIDNVSTPNKSTVLTGGTDYTGAASAFASGQAQAIVGELVNYKVNSDGDYELKTIPAGYTTKKIMGYNGTGTVDKYDGTKKLGNEEVADNAVIFVSYTEGGTAKATVYSGKELKNSNITSAKTSNTTGASSMYSASNGFTYAQVGVVKLGANVPSVSVGANYGYLTADAYQTESGADTFFHYELWTVDGSVSVTEKNSARDLNTLVAGTIITYDTADNDTIKNVTFPSALALSYIKGYDGDKKVQIQGATNSTKIDDDTIILYVDSSETKGVEGGSLAIADKPDGTNYVNNVYYIDGSANSGFALIVMDVDGKMEATGLRNISSSSDGTAVATALATYGTVVVNGDLGDAQTFTVKDGQTVEFTVSQSQTHVITVKKGATVIVPNGTLLGSDGVFSNSADVAMGTASGGVQLTTAGTVTLNKDTKVGAKDTLTFTGTLVGAYDGVKFETNAATTLTAGGAFANTANFYSDAGNATTAGTKVAATAGTAYVWTTVYTNNTGSTAMGWVAQA